VVQRYRERWLRSTGSTCSAVPMIRHVIQEDRAYGTYKYRLRITVELAS
jgi:hypothetical protein